MTKQKLPGPNVLLMGDAGTGKTYSIQTILEAGITPFIIFTEQGMETLGTEVLDKCHWRYIPPRTASFSDMAKMMKNVNFLDSKGISSMSDSNKTKFTGFIDILNQCFNFVDQEGKEFGDVSTWGTDRALIIDGLSGLNYMSMQLVVGGKPVRSMQDWQIAQNGLYALLAKLCEDLQCMFVLLAHLAREKNEVTGGLEVTVNTLGKALAPEIPKLFSDLILAQRKGSVFSWSTESFSVATKTRNVPIAAELPPSFVPLIARWKERGGIVESSTAV